METNVILTRTLAALAAVLTLTSAPAIAATIGPVSATIILDGPRGTLNDRDNINNALDNDPASFFELGYNAIVDFTFGQLFQGPGHIIEITGIPNFDSSWVEAVKIEVGRNGVFTVAEPNPYFNTDSYGKVAFTFAGVFDTLRLTDVTPIFGSAKANAGETGGFDVASISVSPVPAPAAGLLLLTALGGISVLRRLRAAA
jgi:hypothetical protein